MADESKPTDEPIVPNDLSDKTAAQPLRRRRTAVPESIPDAEVVDTPLTPKPGTDGQPSLREQPAPEAEVQAAAVADTVDTRAAEKAAERAGERVEREADRAAPPRRRSGAFLGFVTGGILAAAGGFALARYLPDGWPIANTDALEATVQQQATALAELRTQIDALAAREIPDARPDVAALRDEVEQRLASLPTPPDPAALAAEARSAAEAAVAELDTRLNALERRPAGPAGEGVSDTALAAYERDLQALREAVEGQTGAGAGVAEEIRAIAADTETQLAAVSTEAERLRTEAEAASRGAIARAAVTRILAALDSGGPFSSAVSDLTETGHEVPAILAEAAPNGVPTLPDLRRTFPEVARPALDAALKADMGETWTDRVASYLRTQTGARALTPMDGDDPDAVLSRAEAAINAGQVSVALTELSALPEAAMPALADWVAAAEQREAAIAAVAELSTAMDTE